jgi:hypothetical protein
MKTRTVAIKPHTRSLPPKPSAHDRLHRQLAREIGYRKPYRPKARK